MAKRTFLVNIDLSQNELLNPRIHNLPTTSTPASPVSGQMFYDSTTHKLKFWSATETDPSWKSLGLDLNEMGINSWIGSGSIQTVGTLLNGIWNANIIQGQYGGTGVNNANKTITLGGSLTTTGAFTLTLNTSAITNLTLPTSGTVFSSKASSITSASLLSAMSDETGSGLLVFGTSPTITNGITITNGTKSLTLTIDADGNLKLNNGTANAGFYATGFVSAYGLGTSGGGGGGVVTYLLKTSDFNTNLATYTDDAASANSFNAYSTNLIWNNLITGITGSGNGTITFARNSGTPITFNSTHTHSYLSTSGGTLTGPLGITGNLTVTGDLTINGTTTTINAQNLTIKDKNIILANDNTTNAAADGGGITLKGASDKTFNWVNSTGAWTSSEDINLASGKYFKINGVKILSKYTGIFTTSATSYSITHSFPEVIMAQVVGATSGEVIDCQIATAVAGTTVFTFNIAPAANAYKYIIVG